MDGSSLLADDEHALVALVDAVGDGLAVDVVRACAVVLAAWVTPVPVIVLLVELPITAPPVELT